MEWQPIETAPKDGTTILAFNGAAMVTVYWDRLDFIGHPKKSWRLVDGVYLTCGGTEWDNELDPAPTHWMPLPPPPTEP